MEESSFLNPTQALLAAHMHEGMQVADFGAGSGFFTRAAARLVGDGEVWAVDAHQDMLSRVKNLALAEGLRNVEVVHGNVERAGGSTLPANTFDMVIAANLLFGVEDKSALAAEVKRVLKKGGRVLLIDWKDSYNGLGPHPGHVVTEAVARKIFEDAGFAFAVHVPAGTYHWGFTARKAGE